MAVIHAYLTGIVATTVMTIMVGRTTVRTGTIAMAVTIEEEIGEGNVTREVEEVAVEVEVL